MQKTREEKVLKFVDRWKEEEKEKLVDEMENKTKRGNVQEGVSRIIFQELSIRLSVVRNPESCMQVKSNTDTLKDAREFKEELPQYPQDFQNVVQLLESQESKWTA